MTDRYDEMRVSPDPSQAEALRQRLHAHLASVTRDDHNDRSHHGARLDPRPDRAPMKEIYMSDDSPTNEGRNRRRLAMAAAAAVAVIGLTGVAFAVGRNSGDDEAPAPAGAPTTVAPTTVVPTTVTPTTFAPLTATGWFAGEAGTPVTYTVPDGFQSDFWIVANDAGTGVSFMDVRNIYTEGCQWVLADPPVGPTVDDLVAAYANLPGYAPTAAVDVTVDGYVGKQIEFTVPDFDKDECRVKRDGSSDGDGVFGIWQERGPSDESDGPHFWAQGTNMHNKLLILDYAGTRLVIDVYSAPDATPQDRAALDEIVASIQIG